MKKHPYLFFILFMVVFGAIEVMLTALLRTLADAALAATLPVYYILQALACLSPFFMIGAVAYAMCGKRFLSSLPFFWIYAAAEMVKQIPLAIESYFSNGAYELWAVFVGYFASSLLSSAVYFFLLLLAYLLFVRERHLHEDKFFGISGSDTRVLLLAVLASTLIALLEFIVDFIEHLSEKLYIFDVQDLADAVFSILFIAFCAFLSFTAGRVAMKVFHTDEEKA